MNELVRNPGKGKTVVSKHVGQEKSIQQVDTQAQQDGGSLNSCFSSIPFHLVIGTTPTVTTPPGPLQREV